MKTEKVIYKLLRLKNDLLKRIRPKYKYVPKHFHKQHLLTFAAFFAVVTGKCVDLGLCINLTHIRIHFFSHIRVTPVEAGYDRFAIFKYPSRKYIEIYLRIYQRKKILIYRFEIKVIKVPKTSITIISSRFILNCLKVTFVVYYNRSIFQISVCIKTQVKHGDRSRPSNLNNKQNHFISWKPRF